MQISEKQRAVIEDALDRLALLGLGAPPRPERVSARLAYADAISIVRERPANTRKVRSDAGTKRSKGE